MTRGGDGGHGLVLEARQVARNFGEVHALRGVDLEVHAGEVVGLLGPNGAGKTTLVRIIATLIQRDRGTVSVCGVDPARDPAGVRAHLGLAGQFASVDELLTGQENLELVGRLYGIAEDDCRVRVKALLASLGLEDAAHRRAGTYSGGMRRRLDLGATLIGEPSLLLLDEPTAGLDPRSRLAVWDLIEAIANRGIAVFLTSQDLNEVERLADRVVVIDNGEVVADDHPQTLQRQIGGRVIDVRLDPGAALDDGSLDASAGALAAMGLEPRVDGARRRITANTTGALPAAVAAAQLLIEADVEPTEFALRTPSLEEVFLALTGTIADDDDDEHRDDGRPSGSIPGNPLPARSRPVLTRSAVRDIATVTRRDWTRLLRMPESVFFACVQPVLFVLGLAAVFGDLVENALGEAYIQFLLPGVLVMQVALAAGTTGVGLATDLGSGIIDRFRSLPMAQIAVLAGRTTTDLIRNAIAVVVMVATGFALGFRLEGGAVFGITALAVALFFGYAVTWLFAAVGLAVKDPQTANFIGFAPILIFVYLSSAWVPIETMSPVVQGFARHQPVNVTIEAVRSLAGGSPATAEIIQSLAWSIALILVFGWLSVRQFRTATS
jgi:ABC-2 type transport system ATP-binding protein